MKNKNRCKKAVSLILCLSLLILCLLSFSGCCPIIFNEDNENNNKNIQVVMDIQTKPYHNKDNNKDRCYYTLTSDGEVTETEPFTPDKMEMFSVPVHDCYGNYDIEFKSKRISYLMDIALKDEDGNDVEVTPIISDIFKETLIIDYDMFTMEIFKVGDEYFVYAEHNVNLWYPCVLYYYNQEASRLIELYKFDDEVITGIKIHSLDSINKQYYY